MSAGTLKLTNNSTAIVGTSTLFTTDLKPGDFIVTTIGGVLYTLPVDTVTSNTAATLVSPFTGPTTTGAAWAAVPRKTMNQVTAELVAQSTEALRGLLTEKGVWTNFYTAPGDITVQLTSSMPAVTGPGWQKMAGLVGSALQWRGNLPATANLNTYGPAAAGSWNKGVASGATIANGYPEEGAQGVLEVLPGGYFGLSQRYTVSRNGNVYTRSPSAAWNGADGPWGAWAPAGSKPLNDLGIGLTNLTVLSAFDWQQADFVTGAIYLTNTTTWANIPAGISYPTNTQVYVQIDGITSSETVIELTLIANQTNDSTWRFYKVRIANAKGSRTFSVRQVFTSASTIPIANGGTGETTQAAALTALLGNSAIPVANGGTGGTTQAAARTGLGLGNSSTRNVGTTSGTVAAGDDSRLGTIDGKSGGTINGDAKVIGYTKISRTAPQAPTEGGNYQGWNTVNGQSEFVNHRAAGQGGHRFTIVNPDYTLQAAFSLSSDGNGYAGNGQWISATSGRDTKDKIKEIENPRDKMRLIKAATWIYKSKAMSGKFGIGVIADELYEAFPEAKVTVGDVELDDGSIVEDALSVQAGDSGVTVALHHATILSLMDENESQQLEIEALKSNLEELKKIVEGLIAN